MHIPDGYLSPGTCAALGTVMLPAWGVSAARLKRLGTREVPLLALGSAFSFVIMMFNVPAPGGTTGHAVGSALVAILLGPAAAIVTTTVALAIQALLFGDGGLLTFGANCFNMGFLEPIVAYAIFRALTQGTQGTPTHARRAWAAAIGAYFGLNIAALATAIEVGLQPVIASAADGTPQYCPYSLGVSVPGMLIPHLVVFGLIEAVATAGVLTWAYRVGLAVDSDETKAPLAAPRDALAASPSRYGWVALGILCLLSPVGILAAGDAWGEWAPDELKKRLGYTPPGLERFADMWKGLLPDYNMKGGAESGPGRMVAYLASALVGVALVGTIVWIVGRLVAAKPAGSVAPPLEPKVTAAGADKSGPSP